jgi:hypothetical protein
MFAWLRAVSTWPNDRAQVIQQMGPVIQPMATTEARAQACSSISPEPIDE